MDKVYVVTSGCYSDYGIEAVFSSKEKAELYVAVHYDHNIKSINKDDGHIEEFTIFDSLINGVAYFGLTFCVKKNKLNRPYCLSPVASTSPIAEEIEDLNSNGIIEVTIPTNKYYTDNDEDIRLKIASDWCSKYRSQKLGL